MWLLRADILKLRLPLNTLLLDDDIAPPTQKNRGIRPIMARLQEMKQFLWELLRGSGRGKLRLCLRQQFANDRVADFIDGQNLDLINEAESLSRTSMWHIGEMRSGDCVRDPRGGNACRAKRRRGAERPFVSIRQTSKAFTLRRFLQPWACGSAWAWQALLQWRLP